MLVGVPAVHDVDHALGVRVAVVAIVRGAVVHLKYELFLVRYDLKERKRGSCTAQTFFRID